MSPSDPNGEHAEPLLDAERNSRDIELAGVKGDYNNQQHSRHNSVSSGTFPTKPAGKAVSTYVAIIVTLIITVIGFVVNTEATAYFEDVLGWKKPFCTMYITHGSLCFPWICYIIYLRLCNFRKPFRDWAEDYRDTLCDSIRTIDACSTMSPKLAISQNGPLIYLAATMGIVTLVLTVSGLSWFTSLSLTTPADLTAIYNCSTFFAAAFSVPILREKLGWVSITAVAFSIIGTFIIAYGDTTADHSSGSGIGTSRLLGNLIACVGAVAFGLYEVLFKKWACSSKPLLPAASLPLTLAASALTGIFTFATLWVGLVVLHFTGVEPFVWPSAKVMLWICIAVFAGSVSINLLVVLVVWTDPVFGSMSSVLSVFAVALSDWFVFGLKPSIATYWGGALIIVAFVMLTRDTLGGDRTQ